MPESLAQRKGTVFISYARADDQKPPKEDTTDGWVTFFWNNLRWELTNRGAKGADLWLDRYKIDPAEAFTPNIYNAVKDARLLVAVFSENWALSHWCRQELEAFANAHESADHRVVPIFKENVDRNLLPEILQGDRAKEGYRFFEIDPGGELHEFYWRGLQNREAYNAMVRRVAKFIIGQLDSAVAQHEGSESSTGGTFRPKVADPAQQADGKPSTSRTVFVAESAKELRDARQRLVNDLTGAGHTVVPQIDELPEDIEGYSEAIKAALRLADLAVFLLGERHGDSPSGSDEPIVDLQLRLARGVNDGSRPLRVLWTPKWLPGLAGGKRDPFDVASRFGGLAQGEELFGEEVTDLSQWLRERLVPKPEIASETSAALGALLVMSAGSDDDDRAYDLARLLQNLPRRVQPVASDEGLPAAAPDASPQALIVWGAAEKAAIDARLDQLSDATGSVCLILPGGDEKAKRRYFREGIIAEMLPVLPSDRAAARALLDRLDLLPKGAR